MKNFILSAVAVAILCVLLPATALARPDGVGLGLIVGDPTGVSAKFWLGPRSAIGSALAWSSDDNEEIHLQVDYQRHDFGLFDVDRGSLPVYYGIGGRLILDDNQDGLGVRIPVGLDYIFEGNRFDVFMEVAPVLELTPDSDVTAEAGFGARYFFR